MRSLRVATALAAVSSIGWLSVPAISASPGNLQGSWRVTVKPIALSLCNGPQIAPAPAPFLELASYAGGGVMTETNTQLNFLSASPAFPFNASDGHGTWKADDSEFHVRFTKLLFGIGGTYAGEADLVEDFEVSGDSFTGAFTIRFDFLDQSPSICSGGTLTAQRITAP